MGQLGRFPMVDDRNQHWHYLRLHAQSPGTPRPTIP
jgi:hypothetical protein